MRQAATVTSQAMRGSGTSQVFSPGAMTPALTPALALDYLRELSADLRGGAVLAADGRASAGDAPLAAAAAPLVAAMGDAGEAVSLGARGAVLAARGDGLAIVAVYGPRVMPGLARHDLRQVLADLGAPPLTSAGSAPAAVAPEHAEALLSAAQRGPGE